MTLKQFLGLCEHKWTIIKTINVYETWDVERHDGQLPVYYRYIMQCEKCGKIKKVKSK